MQSMISKKLIYLFYYFILTFNILINKEHGTW